MNNKKICCDCKTEKPLADFRLIGSDCRLPYCRDCAKARMKKYNQLPSRKAAKIKWRHSPLGQKRQREYYQQPDVKKRCALLMAKYRQRPELKVLLAAAEKKE